MCGNYIFIVGLLMALTLHTKSFGTCYNVATLFYLKACPEVFSANPYEAGL